LRRKGGEQADVIWFGGMRERAALLGGTLAIRSAPGKGVRAILENRQASHE